MRDLLTKCNNFKCIIVKLLLCNWSKENIILSCYRKIDRSRTLVLSQLALIRIVSFFIKLKLFFSFELDENIEKMLGSTKRFFFLGLSKPHLARIPSKPMYDILNSA